MDRETIMLGSIFNIQGCRTMENMGNQMDDVPTNGFQQDVDQVLLLLEENPEWEERYARYAKEIHAHLADNLSVRKGFREWSPLKVYLNVSGAKSDRASVRFELRYLGQTVALLKGSPDRLLVTKAFDVLNERDFDCPIRLDGAPWEGHDAARFRHFFKDRAPARNTTNRKGNQEHRLESLLLSEFEKTTGKKLPHIQPVKIANCRFPMPTPLSASHHDRIKYSGVYGGGIDILARTGSGGSRTRLCVIELKDENTRREPPEDAMKQAVAYATFLRTLLRSSAGKDWWGLLGFGGSVPKSLVLQAACAMPSNDNNQYFHSERLSLGDDAIELHSIYFNECGNSIVSIVSSLIPQQSS